MADKHNDVETCVEMEASHETNHDDVRESGRLRNVRSDKPAFEL